MIHDVPADASTESAESIVPAEPEPNEPETVYQPPSSDDSFRITGYERWLVNGFRFDGPRFDGPRFVGLRFDGLRFAWHDGLDRFSQSVRWHIVYHSAARTPGPLAGGRFLDA